MYPSTDDPLVAALQRLLTDKGGHVAVADAAGINDQSLYQIATLRPDSKTGKPKSVGPSIRRRLDAAFPGWMDPPPDRGEDHPMIQGARQTPQLLSWGDISSMEKLPDEFMVALPDNAMVGVAPAGTLVICRKATEASPGQGVIVRDKRGNVHFRECRLRADGGWMAYAYNPAYPSLHDVEDGLQVLAVTTLVTIGWQQLARTAA